MTLLYGLELCKDTVDEHVYYVPKGVRATLAAHLIEACGEDTLLKRDGYPDDVDIEVGNSGAQSLLWDYKEHVRFNYTQFIQHLARNAITGEKS